MEREEHEYEYELVFVVLNYCTPYLSIDCVTSILKQINTNRHRIVIVDNASPDNSVDVISEHVEKNSWGECVDLIISKNNGGFSAGNNMGIKSLVSKHYWLVNSDTLFRSDTVEKMLNAIYLHPKVGLISPRLEWPDETPQISCFRFPTPCSELIGAAGTGVVTKLLKEYEVPIRINDVPSRPEWTSFAAIVLSHCVIEDIGLMDEEYFMYYEDIDMCRRANCLGWEVLHWPLSRVVHLRGSSSPVKAATANRTRRPSYYYRSRKRYYLKYYGRTGYIVANLLWMVGRSIAMGRELMGNKEAHACEKEGIDNWIW